MSEAAIIQGTYADLKFIRTRSVVQIVVEAPITDAPRIVRLLGAPDPATETWLAVAVLSDKPAKQPEVKNKRLWPTLTPTEQAGIRANMEQHSQGERDFWHSVGINPLQVATELYEVSPNVESMRDVVTKWRI